MKTKWFRNIIGGLSFASMLFIFQACYGTPQDFGLDILIEGQVNSKSSGLPVPGIKVQTDDGLQYEITDNNGKFSFYTSQKKTILLNFADLDSLENGHFLPQDTSISSIEDKVYLQIQLAEK